MTRVLIPSGALGLDYDKAALARGVAMKPDLIAIDGGSTDSVDMNAKITTLKSSQDPDAIANAFENGKVSALPAAPEIGRATIENCANIVALAGAEQIAAALNTGADIVIAGRTTDTATIAALPLLRGDHAGAAWHGAKIGECGALCATNPQSGVLMVDFDQTGFLVTPLADGARSTPQTVFAHMLYENSDPFILHEPGGHLDVTSATYVALDETSVRVEGSTWNESTQYTVKLEGARVAGYQTLLMATLRDRRYVENAKTWIADISEKHAAKVADRMGLSTGDYVCDLRLVGIDSTLGDIERGNSVPNEIGVVCCCTIR